MDHTGTRWIIFSVTWTHPKHLGDLEEIHVVWTRPQVQANGRQPSDFPGPLSSWAHKEIPRARETPELPWTRPTFWLCQRAKKKKKRLNEEVLEQTHQSLCKSRTEQWPSAWARDSLRELAGRPGCPGRPEAPQEEEGGWHSAPTPGFRRPLSSLAGAWAGCASALSFPVSTMGRMDTTSMLHL